jgi:4a-hydroxytetrahydrobiopterin dehydratase
MRYTPLTDAEVEALEGLEDWRIVEGSMSSRFRAESFPSAAGLAHRIAEAAEAADHHPDIDIRFPAHVTVVSTTHDTGGLTTHDVDLARTISELAKSHGAVSDP